MNSFRVKKEPDDGDGTTPTNIEPTNETIPGVNIQPVNENILTQGSDNSYEENKNTKLNVTMHLALNKNREMQEYLRDVQKKIENA
jgi:hypothetical protein